MVTILVLVGTIAVEKIVDGVQEHNQWKLRQEGREGNSRHRSGMDQEEHLRALPHPSVPPSNRLDGPWHRLERAMGALGDITWRLRKGAEDRKIHRKIGRQSRARRKQRERKKVHELREGQGKLGEDKWGIRKYFPGSDEGFKKRWKVRLLLIDQRDQGVARRELNRVAAIDEGIVSDLNDDICCFYFYICRRIENTE